ncbi:MAG: hypothetical protein WAL73_03740, partial [Terracidiphilus sp.]
EVLYRTVRTAQTVTAVTLGALPPHPHSETGLAGHSRSGNHFGIYLRSRETGVCWLVPLELDAG